MSLEANILKLTNAVEALTERLHSMEAMVAIPPSAPAAPSREQLEEAYKEVAPAVALVSCPAQHITHEDVQQLCLKIVRTDRSKKADLKRILGEYGAALVADVPADKLEEIKTKLEQV